MFLMAIQKETHGRVLNPPRIKMQHEESHQIKSMLLRQRGHWSCPSKAQDTRFRTSRLINNHPVITGPHPLLLGLL